MSVTSTGTNAAFPITEARAQFGSLVRRTATDRERITITDHGRAAAVFINPRELAELEERVLELEEELALVRYRAEKANGTFVGVPHEEVRKLLGLEDE
ncbi:MULTISPECIES: type II toxin-antitoxin system Phd/YefM family antitoxin [unclassified Streptomyces]|uniref:type II toxin-antitoxin system Phd/YefM family antitoxin n=1 Tax=unclassified Streptomyces TaxID=2593676 RepID=UPI00117D2DA2|nr:MULTISPECIES: type II toxin-antitoxin system Phd/YefM family antitoxin [unclassified Streptomyces]TRO62628.1 type II toxin-antitoxin system Phd/YefM family antitoxin [Streptomyces sp. IB201691-2A2]